MKREILFRGKRVDNGEWTNGYYVKNSINCYAHLIEHGIQHERCYPLEVIPDTIGQLRYENEHGQYFDGDVYYHAGYGNVIVSDLCELQYSLITGTSDDIGQILGNIYDNPELL